MTIGTKAFATSLFASLLTTGCIWLGNKNLDNEAMLTKASQLTKLSTAVESTVRYKNPPAGLDDQGLLKLATQHDPQLLDNFSDYKVQVLIAERHSVVLVCTKDGKQGLLEDAACTVVFDQHLWKNSSSPCEFTLNTKTACPAP
jgi:hypothetical protein